MTPSDNPFVAYLNRYTTVSPEHEAAFDEFISQDGPPSEMTLRLQTRTEQFVRECFQRLLPPSIIVSRIVIDQNGAENLLGRGDLLFRRPSGEILRAQAPFVDEVEIQAYVERFRR